MMKKKFKAPIIWGFLIFIILAIPGNYFPEDPVFFKFLLLSPDKIIHIFLFAPFSFLIMRSLKSSNEKSLAYKYSFIISFVFGMLFGIVTEFLQHALFIGRNGNISDAIADTVGTAIGIIIFNINRKRNWLKIT